MSDNFSNELNSYLFENKQIEVENNSFLKTIRQFDEQFPGNSTIYNSSDYNSSLNSISEIKKLIIENKIPYPDKDEIPEIKIQDLLCNENINNYLFSLTNFDDRRFNKCNKCKINENKFFCEKCTKNYCDNCSKICKNVNHNLINLQKIQIEFEKYKLQINELIGKSIVEPEKKTI